MLGACGEPVKERPWPATDPIAAIDFSRGRKLRTSCPVSVSPSQRKPWRGFFVSSGDPFACASAGALPIERAILSITCVANAVRHGNPRRSHCSLHQTTSCRSYHMIAPISASERFGSVGVGLATQSGPRHGQPRETIDLCAPAITPMSRRRGAWRSRHGGSSCAENLTAPWLCWDAATESKADLASGELFRFDTLGVVANRCRALRRLMLWA